MRLLAVIMLSGCATLPSNKPDAPAAPPSSPEAELHQAWEREVDDAVAGLTAVRPRLTSIEAQVLALYDAQLDGLKALAGSPTVPAVEAKSALLGGKGGPDAIARLKAEKAALDARTSALEASARKAEIDRAAAEARASAAAEEARLANAARDLSRVGAGAIALGAIAFLFGHLVAIPRWAAASTIGLGLLVSTLAPQLLTFFGSSHAQKMMAATFGALAVSGVVSLAIWLWAKLRPATPDEPPQTPPPSDPQGG